jgi:hypothetical protein
MVGREIMGPTPSYLVYQSRLNGRVDASGCGAQLVRYRRKMHGARRGTFEMVVGRNLLYSAICHRPRARLS